MNTTTSTTRTVFNAQIAELFEANGFVIDVIEKPVVLQRAADSALRANEVDFDEFMEGEDMDDYVVRAPRRLMIQHVLRNGTPIVVVQWALGIKTAHILCNVNGRPVIIHEGPVKGIAFNPEAQSFAYQDAMNACAAGQTITAFKDLLDAYCNE